MAKTRKRREVVAGIEMTDANVDRLVERTIEVALRDDTVWHYPQRGRPSLTGKSETSPHVGFRVSPELREQADALARDRGITLSQLAREALEQYVKHA